VSTKTDLVRSHLERLMQRIFELPQLPTDDRGEIRIRHGSALCRVRLLVSSHPHVEVYSSAVAGVDKTPQLLDDINDLNSRLSHARAFWRDSKVIVSAELLGETLDFEELACTYEEVATVSDEEGATLADRHGGRTAFSGTTDEPLVPAPRNGGYL
jgi:Putative bacterial sensory transduction regulator